MSHATYCVTGSPVSDALNRGRPEGDIEEELRILTRGTVSNNLACARNEYNISLFDRISLKINCGRYRSASVIFNFSRRTLHVHASI